MDVSTRPNHGPAAVPKRELRVTSGPSPRARGIHQPTIVGSSPGHVGDISTIIDRGLSLQELCDSGDPEGPTLGATGGCDRATTV